MLVDRGGRLTAIEAKAGRTPASAYFTAFPHFAELIQARGDARWQLARQAVVYGGDESQNRGAGELIGWADLPDLELG